jgi:hypothetical protein
LKLEGKHLVLNITKDEYEIKNAWKKAKEK